MKRVKRILTAVSLVLAAMAFLAGCGDRFTDVEMHVGGEEKIRPIAVVCEPPEAAPGDSVRVSLLFWAPDPAAVHVGWRVSLDYDLGGYEADEVERRVVDLEDTQVLPLPVDDGHGFLTQTFTYVVPDSALLWSSGLPSPMRDEAMIALARVLVPGNPDATSKAGVEAYLRALNPEDLNTMDPMTRAMAFALADRFACRIRFRATLHAGIVVDVTRNLTIRHSRRLGSPNTNDNPEVSRLEVLAIPHPDVEDYDKPEYQNEIVRYPFPVTSGGIAEIRVPRHSDWTYYLVMTPGLQEYTSPFSGDRLFTENDTYRWYYFWMDDPANEFALFRDDPGDPTEMWTLDEHVRLAPPGGGEARYRIIGCLRDERPEWSLYQTSPGVTVAMGELVFVPAPAGQ